MCSIDNSTRDACGIGGICSADGLCECKENWDSSGDFVFSAEDQERCTLNLPLIISLYILLLGLEIFVMSYYAFYTKKRSQFKRLIPFYLYSTICVTITLLKLTDPKLSFTDNILMAVLFGLASFGFNASQHMFLSKYINFQFKLLKVGDDQFVHIIKLTHQAGFVLEMICFCAMCIFISLPIVSEERSGTREALARVGFGLMTTSVTFYCIGSYILFNMIISRLKTLDIPEKMYKKSLLSLKTIGNSAIRLNAIGIPVYLSAAVSKDVLRNYTYVVPIIFSLSLVGFSVTLYGNLLGRREKFKPLIKRNPLKTTNIDDETMEPSIIPSRTSLTI